MARILITSALPYINGIKHLGNLVGSMLPSDAYARYLRQRGHEVLFICATDEHGTPAELAAAAAGLPVAEYCAAMHRTQKDLCDQFHLQFDWFGRSSNPANHRLTQHFAKSLAQNGLLKEGLSSQLYSPADDRFLPDRCVEGTCPNCGYDKARGDQCENCTKQLNPTDLLSPRSAISGATDLELRDTTHLFLLQSRLREQLRTWIDGRHDWSRLVSSIARKWLDDGDGLQDRGITRDLTWGVPVPREDSLWSNMEGKVFYVWFDAPIAYIGATVEWATATGNDWERWWRTDKGADDVRYIEFMAKDNIPFHTLSFPATIMGSGEPWKLVDDIKGFNWLTFDGGKFSTSLKRGVFMDQALEILPADCWRYWLLTHAPESGDSDFTWELLRDTINKDLADVFGNFVNRVASFACRHFAAEVPPGGTDGELEKELHLSLGAALRAYEDAMQAIEFRRATTELRKIWTLGNEYLHRAEPWAHIKTDVPRAAVAIRTALHLIRLQAIISAPFLPATSAVILTALSIPASPMPAWPESIERALAALPAGHKFSNAGPTVFENHRCRR